MPKLEHIQDNFRPAKAFAPLPPLEMKLMAEALTEEQAGDRPLLPQPRGRITWTHNVPNHRERNISMPDTRFLKTDSISHLWSTNSTGNPKVPLCGAILYRVSD